MLRIGAALDREVAAGRLPGADMLVLHNGVMVAHHVCGQLDPGAGVAMPHGAMFRIFSMTKPLVSVAALMLLEDGRLELSDAIADVLPEFSAPRVCFPGAEAPQPAARPITIYDLLTHRSGLTYTARSADPASAALGLPVNPRGLAPDDFLARLAQAPLVAQPGEAWAYGPSTDVLGVLIERVVGQRLDIFLQSRLFAPLGMADTGFHVPSAKGHRLAQPFPHDPQSGAPRTVPDQTFDAGERPAMDCGGAGALSTAADYGRFAQMLLDGGTLHGTRLLSRAAVRLMLSQHLPPGDFTPGVAAFGSPGYGFGLGVAVRHHDGGALVPGNTGDFFWSGTAGTTFFVDPVERLVVVFMAQAPGPLRLRYRRLVRQLVYQALDA